MKIEDYIIKIEEQTGFSKDEIKKLFEMRKIEHTTDEATYSAIADELGVDITWDPKRDKAHMFDDIRIKKTLGSISDTSRTDSRVNFKSYYGINNRGNIVVDCYLKGLLPRLHDYEESRNTRLKKVRIVSTAPRNWDEVKEGEIYEEFISKIRFFSDYSYDGEVSEELKQNLLEEIQEAIEDTIRDTIFSE